MKYSRKQNSTIQNYKSHNKFITFVIHDSFQPADPMSFALQSLSSFLQRLVQTILNILTKAKQRALSTTEANTKKTSPTLI
jgi:hypothetical protein